jgi:hypothetical protein
MLRTHRMRPVVLLPFGLAIGLVAACSGDDPTAADTSGGGDDNAAELGGDADDTGAGETSETGEGDTAAADGTDDAADGVNADAGDADDVVASDLGDGGDGGAGDAGDTGEPPAYERVFTSAADHAAPDGYVWRRAIVHLHSTHSHDACDGNPRVDGEYNYPCQASLRAALCRTRIDVAYLTDHRTHMGETPFLDLLLYEEATDTLVRAGDVVFANRIACEDGHEVTLTVGMETELMPLRFLGPLAEDPVENTELLGGGDAEAAARFRAGGALVWRAHTESIDAAWALERELDGLEIYNLHANIDPRIREEHLGLPGYTIFDDILPYVLKRIPTSPDLALLSFLGDNQPALDTWAQVLEVRAIAGTAGTDAHENVLPPPMVDGERFDSYRRMMSWFSNYVLAEDASPEAFHAALAAGRLFVGFDTLASPDGFDAFVETAEGARLEMGADTAFEAGSTLRVALPALTDERARGTTTRVRVLRVAEGSWESVAESDGADGLALAVEEPGIYRVEVRMVPRHLARYLDSLAELGEGEYPWIYANAFRLLEAPVDR